MSQKACHEQKNNHQCLYEAMEEGVCFHEMVYDQQGHPIDYRIIDINPAYERILGLKKEDLLGKLGSQIYSSDTPPYLDIYSEVARTEKTFRFESYFEPLDLYFKITVVSDKKGQFITIFKDITSHKKMIETLEEKINHLEAINANVPYVIWKTGIDENGTFFNTYISDSIDNFLSLAPHTINNDMNRFINRMKPEYRNSVQKFIQKAIHNPGKMYSYEYEIEKGDGTIACFMTSGKVIASNESLHAHGTTIDITQRRRQEKRLEQTSELLQSILESTNNGILVTGEHNQLLLMNETFVQLWGIPEPMTRSPRLNGRYLIDFVATKLNEPEQFRAKINTSWAEPLKKFSYTLHLKDGSIFDLYSQPLIINKETKGRVLSFIDVTGQRKAEYALKQSEAKFKSYIDNSPEGIFVVDEKGRYIEVNKAACEMTGYSKNELLEKGFMDITSPDDLQKMVWNFKDFSVNSILTDDLHFIRKDGSRRLWNVNAVKLSDNRVLGFKKDVTEQRESDDRLKLAMDSANHGFWDWNLDTGRVYFSPRYYTMLGYEPEELPMELST